MSKQRNSYTKEWVSIAVKRVGWPVSALIISGLIWVVGNNNPDAKDAVSLISSAVSISGFIITIVLLDTVKITKKNLDDFEFQKRTHDVEIKNAVRRAKRAESNNGREVEEIFDYCRRYVENKITGMQVNRHTSDYCRENFIKIKTYLDETYRLVELMVKRKSGGIGGIARLDDLSSMNIGLSYDDLENFKKCVDGLRANMFTYEDIGDVDKCLLEELFMDNSILFNSYMDAVDTSITYFGGEVGE